MQKRCVGDRSKCPCFYREMKRILTAGYLEESKWDQSKTKQKP